MIDTLVVLGADGDLTGRLLLPALATLHATDRLGADFRLVGAGRADWDDRGFAGHVGLRLAEHAPTVATAPRDALASSVRYRRADAGEAADVAAVLELARNAADPIAVYLALPTDLMAPAVRALAAVGLPPGSRVAVEKPFGQDAASAADLNALLATLGPDAAYRVDHALAMTVVRSLPDARLPGTGRSVDWSSRDLAQVDLLWEETLALEGRARFYDQAGALRDVMQNHLAQVLATVAQSPDPADDPSGRRAAVLRAVRPLTTDAIRARTRRARYSAGRLTDGRAVPDYRAEDDVDPSRGTETFAEVVLELDDPRWAGTRFVLRAGKALDARRRGVLLHRQSAGDPIWIDLDDPAEAAIGGAEPAAYQRIVADLLSGGSAFAVGADEAELAWRVFTPVLDAWAEDLVPLTSYPAGSAGPA